MEREDIEKVIDVRAHLISLYDYLDGKHEPHSVIKQSLVANELSQVIVKIDKLLKDKVKFAQKS